MVLEENLLCFLAVSGEWDRVVERHQPSSSTKGDKMTSNVQVPDQTVRKRLHATLMKSQHP